MKGTRHSDEQIIAVLKQGEAGSSAQRGLSVRGTSELIPLTPTC